VQPVFTYTIIEGETVTVEPLLTVVGTAPGLEPGVVYAPFWTVSRLAGETDGLPAYTERLAVTLADNRRLSEFKQTAWRSFPRAGPVWDSRPFSMTIYDSAFYDILEPLRQNIILIDVATPFVYLVAVAVGFLVSFLLTRRRRAEFAIMRSVGIGKWNLFAGALMEQAVLCAAGAAAGMLVVWVFWGYGSVTRPAIYLGCYTVGAAFSAIKAAGTDVLKILREKE
jgi:hypothetical protein